MTPLPVVLDATALSGVASGSGVGTYTRNLLAALGRRADVRPIALCTGAVHLPPGVEQRRIRRLTDLVAPERPRAQIIEHAVRLPVDLRFSRPSGSVFHNPSYHAPLGVGAPWVQTLLDVIPLMFDSPDQAALRARWRRFGPRYLQADSVVAISRHAAQEATRVLGLDPTRIRVAHLGVDAAFCPNPDPADRLAGPPYLLVVGEYSQRKGFAEAFALIDDLVDAGYPHRLVVAGRVHPWGADDLRRLHAAARHPDRIEIRGYVDDLVSLYRNTSCFVMSSRYEGFGLPALEAMACGAPVVAFDNSAVTEVVGGGGHLVADGDVAALTAAVRRLLDSAALAADTAERGMQHARRFTWEASAAVHVETYRAAWERVHGG